MRLRQPEAKSIGDVTSVLRFGLLMTAHSCFILFRLMRADFKGFMFFCVETS